MNTLILLSLLFVSVPAQIVPNGISSTCPSIPRKCPYGEFDNGNLCIPCPPNTISAETGASKCKKCPSGTYPDKYRRECGPCKPGYSIRKDSRCLQCPLGSYSNSINQFKCTRCPGSQFTWTTGSSSKSACQACEKGQFIEHEQFNMYRCEFCPQGSYQDKTGQQTCKVCPMGTGNVGANAKYDSINYDTVTKCPPCPPGTFGKLKRHPLGVPYRSCYPCPAGTYTPRNETTDCLPCPPGSTSSDDRYRCTVSCKAGQPKKLCRACPPGTQPHNGDVSNCRECPPGTVNSNFSVTACVPCPLGLVPTARQDGCVCRGNTIRRTPADSINDDDQILRNCKPCPARGLKINETTCGCSRWQTMKDSYTVGGVECRCPPLQKEIGRKCMPCSMAELTTAQRTGLGCNLCRPGQFFHAQSGTCRTCPVGTKARMDLKGVIEKSCEPCQLSYEDKNGVRRCGCRPGLLERNGKCEPCRPGSILEEGADYCTDCGQENYIDVQGATACKKCPVGRRYSFEYQQTTCPPLCPENSNTEYGSCTCNNGFIQRGQGSKMKCIACPPNQTPSNNQRKCICKNGHGLEGQTCVICPPGTVSRENMCKQCPVNQISTKNGSLSCTKCPTGSYSIFMGGTRCVRCPKGKFVTKNGGCGRCPVGHRVCNGECVACVGSVSLGGDISYCMQCAKDMVPSTDKSQCLPK